MSWIATTANEHIHLSSSLDAHTYSFHLLLDSPRGGIDIGKQSSSIGECIHPKIFPHRYYEHVELFFLLLLLLLLLHL